MQNIRIFCSSKIMFIIAFYIFIIAVMNIVLAIYYYNDSTVSILFSSSILLQYIFGHFLQIIFFLKL